MAAIEIYVLCAKCGSPLESVLKKTGRYNGDNSLEVEPCEKCLEEADLKGFEEGRADHD